MKTPSLTILLLAVTILSSTAQIRKVVAIGSSTTEGQKATPVDSSWVARFNYYYKYQMGVLDSIYNLGVGGYTVYRGMPSSYSKSGRPAPDPTKNVTKAFSLLKSVPDPSNGVVIVNFPTNGYETYTIAEIMNCLHVIYDSATRAGNRCYVTTTQPRTSGTFATGAIKKKLAQIKDLIIAEFGEANTLNFWDGMFNPADTSILAIYSAGDKTHFNNAGHKELFNRVVAKNVLNLPMPTLNDYRSNVTPSGNWEVGTNWQRWNGTNWVKAASPPSTADQITILGGDIININTTIITPGNITINKRATLNAGSQTINVAGDWTNLGTFTSTGTIVFNGATDQSISGTTQFTNVTLATGGNVQLNGATTINGVITLTSGTFTGTSTYPLMLGPSASFAGGSESSFIIGPLRKHINGGETFLFPVGGNDRYRPATIANTGISDDWTVEYIGSNPANSSYPPTSFNDANIGSVSAFEFWNVTPSNAANHADLTLTYNTGSYLPPNIGDVSKLIIAHWNSLESRWDKPAGGGSVSQAGTNTSGSITVTNITSFSPLTIGSLDEDSPLPVEWSSFIAERHDTDVTLTWTTAQERNNSHFDIERSVDGRSFTRIGTRAGGGNSNTLLHYQFIDKEAANHISYYYRIRQVDVDGMDDYSRVVLVMAAGKPQAGWHIWPNPIMDQQPINIIAQNAIDDNMRVEITITAPTGMEVFRDAGALQSLTNEVAQFIHNAAKGVYGIHITDGSRYEHHRVVRY